MTKVPKGNWALISWLILLSSLGHATTPQNPPSSPAEQLYLQLGHVGLDPARVYEVRDASLDRSAIHISLDDGTIAFTQDVMGRVTGAFFAGEGEILISPPNEVERRSMSTFTGMAILEERFATAYFRFNDDVVDELKPDLRRPEEDPQDFVQQWNQSAQNLASADAMRLLVSFVDSMPQQSSTSAEIRPRDRMFHARLQGIKLGVFDVEFDSLAAEKIQVGQLRSSYNGREYYDVWASFSPQTRAPEGGRFGEASQSESSVTRQDPVGIRKIEISSVITPPKQISCDATLSIEIRAGEPRALLFELSRFLSISKVEVDGSPVGFIHNPAIEGTQLSRRGNDLVAVILSHPVTVGQKLHLHFVYSGDVLADAGSGLLYVGERGTWYPNRGMEMTDFDLRFRYPTGWTLVATGTSEPATAQPSDPEHQQSRWVSERPMPVAGFDLGKYKVATVKAGNIPIETYATIGVERDFPTGSVQIVNPPITPNGPTPHVPGIQMLSPDNPSPTRMQMSVAESAAAAIRYYSELFGPYPYGHLALTQMPGNESQGWPSLIFLSSYAFLSDQERADLHFDALRRLMQEQIPAHETAHQWWGDLVCWSTYRDQWLSEALANYSALMLLQQKDPEGFTSIMTRYRDDLLTKNRGGVSPAEAGPVTLGARLLSSHFPEGYEAISYGRGTWLFHMLRTMLQDAATPKYGTPPQGPDEPFVKALREIRDKYQGKSVSTREVFEVFADQLPPSVRYEGKKSLDWFLVGWVNGTALPKFELQGLRFAHTSHETIVSGTILQKQSPEDLVTSVPIYASFSGKRLVLLGRVFADGDQSSFRLVAPAGTRKIVVDPYQTMLTNPK